MVIAPYVDREPGTARAVAQRRLKPFALDTDQATTDDEVSDFIWCHSGMQSS
jgi:hypothetical protein